MAKEEVQNPAEGKLKALQAAMSKIEKDFGKGSIMRMGDELIEDVEVIPTGRSTEGWRHSCVHRCRARCRPFLCAKVRCRRR